VTDGRTDGQTDRRTDGRNCDSICALSIYAVARKNYRPISLTCVAGKVMERLIANEIYKHLQHNDLLSNVQHGFVNGESTCTNLLECFNDWTVRAVPVKKTATPGGLESFFSREGGGFQTAQWRGNCAVVYFEFSFKKALKKIPFCYSRKRQKAAATVLPLK